MSHLPTSAQPFVCTPLDESRPLAYTLWKTDFLSQASTRDLAGFYIEPNHVPRGNRLEALKVSKTYLELDEIDNWEFYVVDISLSEYDRNLRLAEIKAHTAAIQVKAINVEAGKKLAAQCSAAHTFLVSAISVNLRRLYQTTVCPYSLFELLKVRFESNPMDNNPTVIANHLRTLKFTEESCIDTLAVELTDLVKRYRVSMTPPSFNLLDASAISSIDYDTHIWNYHTLCAMSDTFINDKELWEVVTNYVSTARAAGTPVVVDGVWVSLRRILTNRLQRASALGDHGSAATIQSRSQFAAVTHAVAAPAPPSTAISQPDGSYHVLNAFTIPAYAHHDCVKIPGKSCFYCGVANHTLPVCPTLKTDYVRNTMRAGFYRTVFDKHGSASAKKRKRDVAMTVTVVVVITVATVDMDVMTVALGVALAVETAAVIVLAVKTAVLVVMTVTPATLLMMQSTVTLDAVVLRLLPTTPSYHPPSTVSSKSLNRLACYPKFLLRALPHCSTYLHRRRALHYLRLLRLLRLCHWRQLPSNRPHCQPTTGLPLTPVISTSLKSRLTRSSLPTVYTSTHHARYSKSLPTKVDLPLFPPSAFLAARSDVITAASETPIKVVLQLPPRCVDGVRPHPPFQVIKGNGIFALHADLRYCANDAGDPPLPQSVTYGPANFPALREHWIVDSGASTSCTPNRDYFSRYIPCALSLTVGNGARLPVVGYGAISMLVDMSSRDQVDDIRPCTLRLNFGLHCPELQFNLFSVRQASDDDITVRFPARDVCEIT
ncbi:hypothetical protein DYB30_013164, partial [Aphanomyces astaci]